MNLINDSWIPVRRRDGTLCDIAPWQIGHDDNPVMEIRAPRPDFRGALYQFLIGLVQTAFAPADIGAWKELWDDPPECERLKHSFERFAEAFELINENGPAFMQDYNLPASARSSPIASLLTTSPGSNAVKLNKDLFFKRHSNDGFCSKCVAAAIFTLQTNGIAVGSGYRTGIRGGGPLTTLVRPDSPSAPIWEIIWLNVLSTDERFGVVPDGPSSDVFPWMGPTRDSHNDKKTFPEQVSELQSYWGMPQRIRLDTSTTSNRCSVCGRTASLFSGFVTTNYGISYSSSWIHALSPFRVQQETDGSSSIIATKGRLGGFSYPDWLSLTLTNQENEHPAPVIRAFCDRKVFELENQEASRVWCFGYDAENATIRRWHDQTMPIIALPLPHRSIFIEYIEKTISAANDTAWLLRNQIKAAWFERPADAKGDTSTITTSFWQETEAQFYAMADELRAAIIAERDTTHTLAAWRSTIINRAEELFDRFALQETDSSKNMRRIAQASKALSNILRSPKTKSIEALREVV